MHANHGQVGLGVVSDQVSLMLVAVGQGHIEPAGPMNNVAIRENVSARREDKPRAAPLPRSASPVV